MNKNDLFNTEAVKKIIESYGIGTLKNSKGNNVNSPQEAKEIASQKTNQSYTDSIKKFRKHDRFGVRKK